MLNSSFQAAVTVLVASFGAHVAATCLRRGLVQATENMCEGSLDPQRDEILRFRGTETPWYESVRGFRAVTV